MRIALLAMGSRGDVDPMIALGRGLRDAGHDVAVTVPADLTEKVSGHGLTARAFDVDVRTASGEDSATAWQNESSRGLRREATLMADLMATLAEPIADGVLAAVTGADLVVSGPLTFEAAAAACQHYGVDHVLATLAPTTPGRDGSATVYAVASDRNTVANKLVGVAAAAAAYRVFRPTGALVRERLGLPPGSLRQYLRTAYGTPALLACSPTLVPTDPSWGAQLHSTGVWRLPSASWQPPIELERFLAAGPPPVFAGFGSMVASERDTTVHALLEAARRNDQRLIIGAGWAQLSGTGLPPWAHIVDEVPHDWLFPRTAAVVHHGGAGTTHTAARAGVAQVVVPHVGDQPYWGRRTRALGIGGPPVPRHELDADRLAASLRVALAGGIAARARAVGEDMRREDDGVVVAVRQLSRLASRAGRGGGVVSRSNRSGTAAPSGRSR